MSPFKPSKRHFLISSIALTGCAVEQNFFETQPLINNSINYGNIRQPKLGQQWIYAVRNAYNNEIEDEITEIVTAITPAIIISRTSARNGLLPSEIHSNWGMITQDPYWNPAVKFLDPMPAWPQNKDEVATYASNYQVLADPYSAYRWSSKLSKTDFESIAINNMAFDVLKSVNQIYFQSNDATHSHSYRMSSIWLSPEIGRWVVKITNGYYLQTSSGKGADRKENYLRYELKSWK
jgi:hypothetical protein